jgi:hypothetical protein
MSLGAVRGPLQRAEEEAEEEEEEEEEEARWDAVGANESWEGRDAGDCHQKVLLVGVGGGRSMIETNPVVSPADLHEADFRQKGSDSALQWQHHLSFDLA